MNEYACYFNLLVDRQDKYSPYTVVLEKFVSENTDLVDFIYFEADFYFDHEEIEKLETGEYSVYVRGVAEFESDVDWESGIEEGHYLLGVDKITIKKLEELDDDESTNL